MKNIIFRKSFILIFLLITTLTLVILVLFKIKITSIESATIKSKVEDRNQVNHDDYKKNMYKILGDYEKIIKEANIYATSTKRDLSSDDLIVKKINDLKIKIMETKAPSFEYKDLHLSLTMSLLSMQEYIANPQDQNMKICNDNIIKVKKSSALLLD